MRHKAFVLLVVMASWLAGHHAVSAWSDRAVQAVQGVPDALPSHLRIMAADIEELRPIDFRDVPGRKVRLRLELAGPPPCGSVAGALEYGFLIDADRSAASGFAGAFEGLGIDARVSIACDAATRQLTSRIGRVVVTPDPKNGRTYLDVETIVRLLPAVDFLWMVYAVEGSSGMRLPALGRPPGAWRISERWLH